MSVPIPPKPLFNTLVECERETCAAGSVEVVENGEIEATEYEKSPTNATTSSSPPSHGPLWPEDSVLNNFIGFAREYSESEDPILIGSILPVVARVLARNVYIRFSGRKYPNVYNVLVTPPGYRKSTTINLAENVARELLDHSALLEGASSDQALFKAYQCNADRLLIEDEGNTLLSNWSSDAAGKLVAKRFLRLYDCRSWTQNYIKQEGEGGGALQRIEATSTSLLVGTTYNNCRFNGLETKDGMRRRVNYYVSERMARTIYWPADFDGGRCAEVVELFRPLLALAGEFKPLSGASMTLWHELQDSNRTAIQGIQGNDAASEAYASALAEENAKILKFAMMFEVCRWASDKARDWTQIQPDTLQVAADHGRECLAASKRLDQIGRRAEIRDEADAILATIRSEFPVSTNGNIQLTKTDLTHRFAANPSRRGAMTPTRLYTEVIADLKARGIVQILRPNRKLFIYCFEGEVA